MRGKRKALKAARPFVPEVGPNTELMKTWK